MLLVAPTWLGLFGAGVVASSTAWVVVVHVLLQSGTGPQMSGDLAERCTATQLRRLQRHGWHIANAVWLRADRGDIDHVAIGPGGIVAVETKWIGASCDTRARLNGRVTDAVGQISTNAARLFLMFKSGVPSTAYASVIVLWGPGAERWPGTTEIGGVTVLRGPELRTWFAGRSTRLMTDATVEGIWATLVRTLDLRDENARTEEGVVQAGFNR
jgi:hypothetical protein